MWSSAEILCRVSSHRMQVVTLQLLSRAGIKKLWFRGLASSGVSQSSFPAVLHWPVSDGNLAQGSLGTLGWLCSENSNEDFRVEACLALGMLLVSSWKDWRAATAQTGWISQLEVNGEKGEDVSVVTLINLSLLKSLLQIEVKCWECTKQSRQNLAQQLLQLRRLHGGWDVSGWFITQLLEKINNSGGRTELSLLKSHQICQDSNGPGR